MGNSIRDQLLKAGLVNKKQANKAKQAQLKKQKEQRKAKDNSLDENKLLAQQARAAEAERVRRMNLKKKEENRLKEVAGQVRQLLATHRLPLDDGEIAYNFVDNTKIKKIYVSEPIRDKLSNGRLAIVRYDEKYEVVAVEAAEKVLQRDNTVTVIRNQPKATTEDDPYAEFPIPDDLDW